MNWLFEYSKNKRLRGLGEWLLRRHTYANSFAELHWWEFWIMIHNSSFATNTQQESRKEVET
jgi:hypothetical protein